MAATSSDEDETAALRVTVEREPAAAAGAGSAGDVVVLAVSGDLDYDNAAELRAALHGALDSRPAGLVLDLAQLHFLDSTGMGVIVGGWQRAGQAGVRYVLRRVPSAIVEHFEVTGLTEVLRFEDHTFEGHTFERRTFEDNTFEDDTFEDHTFGDDLDAERDGAGTSAA